MLRCSLEASQMFSLKNKKKKNTAIFLFQITIYYNVLSWAFLFKIIVTVILLFLKLSRYLLLTSSDYLSKGYGIRSGSTKSVMKAQFSLGINPV